MKPPQSAAGYFPEQKRALLRADRGKSNLETAVAFDRPALTLSLKKRGALLLDGDCAPRIAVDGRSYRVSEWEEVCWISDDDADYLELDGPLKSGWSVQRQILLAREDQFLLLADAVLAPGGSRIDYRCELPLAAGASYTPQRETWEGWLSAGRAIARVMPLALPEWRAAPGDGALDEHDGRLTLRHARSGCRLFAPLFFDLHPRREKQEATWRRLTVGRMLSIEPPDVAVGFRAQVGASQWLFYRSLAPEDNRTVLGQNLTTEFLAARFSTSGDIDRLVEVETE